MDYPVSSGFPSRAPILQIHDSEIFYVAVFFFALAVVCFLSAISEARRQRERRVHLQNEFEYFESYQRDTILAYQFFEPRPFWEDLKSPALGLATGFAMASWGTFLVTQGEFILPASGLFLAIVGLRVSVCALAKTGQKRSTLEELILESVEGERMDKRMLMERSHSYIQAVPIEKESNLPEVKMLDFPASVARQIDGLLVSIGGQQLSSWDALMRLAETRDVNEAEAIDQALRNTNSDAITGLPVYWALHAAQLARAGANRIAIRDALIQALAAGDNDTEWLTDLVFRKSSGSEIEHFWDRADIRASVLRSIHRARRTVRAEFSAAVNDEIG